jgi:hypothetical protein
MSDDFMMTAFERKQIELQEQTLNALYELHADIGALRGAIESLSEAIDDMADDEDDVPSPPSPPQITAGGTTFYPTVTRWHGTNGAGIMSDLTKAVSSISMTYRNSPDTVTKKDVDGQGT